MKAISKYVVIQQFGGAFGVYIRKVGDHYSSEDLISAHYTKAEANTAKRRYEANDKRRTKP